MAGTDHARSVTGNGPAIVLVRPQLGENIGACARAMLNCGLNDMRLVSPRDGWPNPAAEAMAAGAIEVLHKARVYPTTAEACGDLTYVLATTARPRGITKEALVPRAAAAQLRARIVSGQPAGVLFGPERAGLLNEDVTLADAVITVPLNPGFASLNLAQAVLLIGYEWFQSGDETPDVQLMSDSPPARVETREFLFSRLEEELEEAQFFYPDHLGPTMKRNLRALFTRAGLSDQEVQSLHGVIKSLTGKRRRGPR
jgi:tRNA/rRNA methyltransferase